MGLNAGVNAEVNADVNVNNRFFNLLNPVGRLPMQPPPVVHQGGLMGCQIVKASNCHSVTRPNAAPP